jgi:hypothetical protein
MGMYDDQAVHALKRQYESLKAEVERLRSDLKESHFTIECLSGTPEHGGSEELKVLREKAALADEMAGDPMMRLTTDKTLAWLVRYDTLTARIDAQKETT